MADQSEKVKEAEAPKEDRSLDGVDADMSVKVVLGSIIEAGKKIGLATGLLVPNKDTPEPDDVQVSQSANSALAAASVAAPVASMAVAAARSFSEHFDDIKQSLSEALPENIQGELKDLVNNASLNDYANQGFKVALNDTLEVATQGLDPTTALDQNAGLNA